MKSLNLNLCIFNLFLDHSLLGYTEISDKSIIMLKDSIENLKNLEEIIIWHYEFENINILREKIKELGLYVKSRSGCHTHYVKK